MLLHSVNGMRLSFQSLSKDKTSMSEVEMFDLPLLLRVNSDGRQCAAAPSVGRPELIQCPHFKLARSCIVIISGTPVLML